MNEAVQPRHQRRQLRDGGRHRRVVACVALDQGHGGGLCGLKGGEQALEPLAQARRLVAQGDLAAGLQHSPGDRPGDAVLVGDAHDEHVLVAQQAIHHGGTLPDSWAAGPRGLFKPPPAGQGSVTESALVPAGSFSTVASVPW